MISDYEEIKGLPTSLQNSINLISPCGFGDTMILCGLKSELEKLYSEEIHFIIKPQHKIVMKMYNINNYSIKEFTKEELFKLGELNNKPEKGSFFVAHPLYNNENELLDSFNKNEIDFLSLYKRFLGLKNEAIFRIPEKYSSSLPKDLANKLSAIAPLNKIILIAPEANSFEDVNKRFFEQLVIDLKDDGYTVISSVVNPKNRIKGSMYLKLNMEEAMIISSRCKAVYATCSGFCVLIASVAKQLTVFYSDIKSCNNSSLKKIYGYLPNVSETAVIGSIMSNITPFISVENKNNERIYRFCLQFLRIKSTKQKLKICLFGIPIFQKFKNK